jgi:subtilisin family serine protease
MVNFSIYLSQKCCLYVDVTMNVESAWSQGFTGKGVTVALLDEGLEWTHSEILDSYDPESSTGVEI